MNDYLSSIELDPNYAQPYHGLGLLMDKLGKYEEAINEVENNNYHLAILDYYNKELTYIEKKFLHLLSNEIYEIDTNNYNNSNKQFFSIYGEFNEIEKVIADINKNKYKLGDVSVITSNQKYESIIRSAFSSRKIDYSYVSNSLINYHPLISLINDIFEWAMSNYDYKYFKKILENEYVSFNIPYMEKENKYGYINKEYIYQLGIDSGIGYGLDRYVSFNYDLRENRKSFFENFKEKNLGIDVDYIKNDVIDSYLDFLSFLICVFEKENIYNPYILLDKILNIKVNDESIINKVDKEVKLKIERILFALTLANNTTSLKETILLIQDKINNISTSENKEDNKIEVLNLTSVKVLDRKHIYFLGLSYDAFEPSLKDSPVLTDEILRKCLDTNYYIDYSLEKSKRKRKIYLDTINTASSSNLYFIRSNYSTSEFRASAPSLIYNELLGKNKEIVEYKQYANLLDINDNESFKQKFIDNNKLSSLVYEEIANDGHKIYKLICPLTASQLNNLASCPLKYIYSKEYFSNELEDRNSCQWLNQIEKGNLYHYVLEDYCRLILGTNSKDLSDSIMIDEFNEIYEKNIEKFKQNVVIPSDAVFEIESKEMREDLIKYINNLHNEFKTKYYQIYKVEEDFNKDSASLTYSINKDGSIYEDGSLDDELQISFKVNTRMDRVDYNENNETYRIVDYKTGSKFSNKKLNKSLQWFVYPFLEKADSFEYHFLCDKSKEEIERIEIKNEKLESIPKEVAKSIYEFLVNGKIDILDNDEDEDSESCEYCQYKDICLKKLAIKRGDNNGL